MTQRLVKKCTSTLLFVVMFASVFVFPASTSHAATIQVTDNGSRIEVNTGSGLVYVVNKTNGDIISAKMNGTELNSNRGSHIGSGLGSSANVTWNKSPSRLNGIDHRFYQHVNTLLCFTWRREHHLYGNPYYGAAFYW